MCRPNEVTQGSLIFHDTTGLDDPDLGKAVSTAKKQKDLILKFFECTKNQNWTPEEVHDELTVNYTCIGSKPFILLTSVRRSITDLTKEGRLIKCQRSEQRMGRYGKLNYTWRWNPDYQPPINPRPHFENPRNFYEKMNP